MQAKIENAKLLAMKESSACEGASGMVQQMIQQVQNAARASQMQGVPAQEQSIAMKYLQPLMEFCAQTDAAVVQQLLRAQGKVQALTALQDPSPAPPAAPAVPAEQVPLPLGTVVDAPATSAE